MPHFFTYNLFSVHGRNTPDIPTPEEESSHGLSEYLPHPFKHREYSENHPYPKRTPRAGANRGPKRPAPSSEEDDSSEVDWLQDFKRKPRNGSRKSPTPHRNWPTKSSPYKRSAFFLCSHLPSQGTACPASPSGTWPSLPS